MTHNKHFLFLTILIVFKILKLLLVNVFQSFILLIELRNPFASFEFYHILSELNIYHSADFNAT